MARRGKYRHLTPDLAGEAMWSAWTAQRDTMISRYTEEITRATTDPDSRNRYVAFVSQWITNMRTREVREAIASALAKAKSAYRRAKEALAEKLKAVATAPAR